MSLSCSLSSNSPNDHLEAKSSVGVTRNNGQTSVLSFNRYTAGLCMRKANAP